MPNKGLKKLLALKCCKDQGGQVCQPRGRQGFGESTGVLLGGRQGLRGGRVQVRLAVVSAA